MESETELLTAVKSGNEDAFQSVILLYDPLLKSAVSELLQDGLFTRNDVEDLRQEAVIALYQAVASFDQSQTAVTFGLYAKICIKNQLLSVRRKRQRTETVGSVDTALDKKQERKNDSGFFSEEAWTAVEKTLSAFEVSVYRLYLREYDAAEIAVHLGRNRKSVENALYRIRRKFSEIGRGNS